VTLVPKGDFEQPFKVTLCKKKKKEGKTHVTQLTRLTQLTQLTQVVKDCLVFKDSEMFRKNQAVQGLL